ncbi:hypothetical protein C8J56DRAFT_934773 [Mycena floridula]|nr:hypothetical protein C8J56DRAFT_934773 [Mycena floridula]
MDNRTASPNKSRPLRRELKHNFHPLPDFPSKRPEKRQRSGAKAKKEDIDNARRLADRRKPLGHMVYVGNLNVDTNERDLRAFFAPCGAIVQLEVRYNRAASFTYASVLFRDTVSATEALNLDGCEFGGQSVPVSSSAFAMPEMAEVLRHWNEEKETIPEQKTARGLERTDTVLNIVA